MTRINVSIPPADLCDQMLLAELRELPRCYAHRQDGGPERFTLGAGHVLWCSRYQRSLAERHLDLREEAAIHRGFLVAPMRVFAQFTADQEWSFSDLLDAYGPLTERIKLRLSQMVRQPKWTNRPRPSWCTPSALPAPTTPTLKG